MTVKSFADSNVVLYTIGKDAAGALAIRYQLSHWDALIVAAALLAGCDTLYSEDLQHGQVFEDRLTVENPFLVKTA